MKQTDRRVKQKAACRKKKVKLNSNRGRGKDKARKRRSRDGASQYGMRQKGGKKKKNHGLGNFN